MRPGGLPIGAQIHQKPIGVNNVVANDKIALLNGFGDGVVLPAFATMPILFALKNM